MFPEGEEDLYSVRSTQIYKILETLLQFAEIYAFKSKKDESIEIYKFVQDAYLKIFGTE